MDELKPCPFCGCLAELSDYHTKDYCVCSNAECPMDGAILSITEWNTRASDPRVVRLVEAAKAVTMWIPTTSWEIQLEQSANLRAALAEMEK